MAEKKKMSVAEILAAARAEKAAAQAAEPAAEPAASAESPAPAAATPITAESSPAASAPAAKPKSAAPGERPKISDVLAMARAGGKAGAAKPAAAVPVAKSEAPPKAPKAAPAATPVAAAPVAGGPKDTASILAAARKASRPGPMTKAEAAAREKPAAAKAAIPGKHDVAAKGKPALPPMPAKPAYAKPKAKADADEDRRGVLGFMLGSFLGVGFTSLTATSALWALGTTRFMFPNVLTEPPSQFKVGFPSDFAAGSVADKFKAQYGVWVVNGEYNGRQQIYALRTVCTHLGCTPNWLEGEQKFKCPCHGSGFYKDGINFEGPAPRPLERYAIRIADDGQLEIDKSKLFQEEMGQWSDPTSFVQV